MENCKWNREDRLFALNESGIRVAFYYCIWFIENVCHNLIAVVQDFYQIETNDECQFGVSCSLHDAYKVRYSMYTSDFSFCWLCLWSFFFINNWHNRYVDQPNWKSVENNSHLNCMINPPTTTMIFIFSVKFELNQIEMKADVLMSRSTRVR